ncbi:hypothetical protein IscW_ISCW012476 [Ixodes scapularis]|uniref:Uncharacterized protein n=1 Tax=Ixodes scapularis TaxID=6945 RepID=B7QBM9_IXOSC|nr:hypothetical protein IscW_ISCW012476 [Ixodes scapularis]|eukprot:XP_002400854.1 hypothetical protein IscW_ISCW012476 [Ixodes scapularis]
MSRPCEIYSFTDLICRCLSGQLRCCLCVRARYLNFSARWRFRWQRGCVVDLKARCT